MKNLGGVVAASAAVLTFLLGVPTEGRAARVGEQYMVDGRCVTVNELKGAQARYQWTEGSSRGSGNLPADELTEPCGGTPVRPVAAPPAAPPAAVAPPTRTPAAGSLALSATEAAAMVEAHNTWRSQVGVGPLGWDHELSAYAQQYVQTLAGSCGLRHSQGSGHGENLAAWTRPSPPTQAVAQWGEEKSSYRGGGGPMRHTDMAASHYTQMVWRDTRRVGCGRTTCTKGGITWTLLSCNYSPAGNMMGSRVY